MSKPWGNPGPRWRRVLGRNLCSYPERPPGTLGHGYSRKITGVGSGFTLTPGPVLLLSVLSEFSVNSFRSPPHQSMSPPSLGTETCVFQ